VRCLVCPSSGLCLRSLADEPVALLLRHSISILIPPSSLGKLTPLLSHPLTDPPATLDSPCLLSLPRLAQSAPATDVFVPEHERAGRQVGNFLMSSCPGKKVRLGGPVKGRGAICRDLEADLRRIKSLGVGAMIWCGPFHLTVSLPCLAGR
jgi:hypothetical protein